MRNHLVITISGHDRSGIVEEISKLVLEYQGNVEASRMARLGGEFASIMLVSAPEDKLEALREGVRALRENNFKVTTRPTERGQAHKFVGWLPYQVVIKGADHEGIVHHITRHLAGRQINIETMDTDVLQAPMSGAPLFTMTAIVLVPPTLPFQAWRQELEAVGDELGVDVSAKPYTG